MESVKEERFVLKVVEMYYKQGLSQSEIGKKLNVSRTKISRTLSRARTEGYVHIKINYPKNSMISVEEQLEKKFGLKEAIIAYERDSESISDEVAFLASDYIVRVLKNKMILALTRGTTLQKTIACLEHDMRLKFLKLEDVKVIPLMGATNISLEESKSYRAAYSNYLIDEAARIINANSYQILAPQYVTDPGVKENLMKEETVKEVIDLAKNADIAVFGIGTLNENSATINAKIVPMEEFKRLQEKGGVGEVLSRVFDKEGNLISDDFDRRLICLGLEDLKKIPIRVGVAYGIEKTDAILGALRGGIVNVLITDNEVAAALNQNRR